jgi:hypothetical protein
VNIIMNLNGKSNEYTCRREMEKGMSCTRGWKRGCHEQRAKKKMMSKHLIPRCRMIEMLQSITGSGKSEGRRREGNMRTREEHFCERDDYDDCVICWEIVSQLPWGSGGIRDVI